MRDVENIGQIVGGKRSITVEATKGLQHYKKETLAQLFFREFYKISKNTFFTEHLRATASVTSLWLTCKISTC